jgi:hypothetical protein
MLEQLKAKDQLMPVKMCLMLVQRTFAITVALVLGWGVHTFLVAA